ncbi:MAG: hypothetical protein KAJ49_10005 [Arcobacteraceae bacterium]|nr:hypothetical protein [Arcobacteraceae bacterium]
MHNQNNQIILKEGFNSIAIVFVVSLFLLIFVSDFLGNLGFLITFVLLFIYRNPSRNSYITHNDIISPVDGRVSAIDITHNKYKIYIDVSLCDTHILRAPISSKFKVKSKINGLNLNSSTFKAKILNTQAVLKFDDIKVKLVSGVCNSDIILYKYNKVKVSQDIGLFLNGVVIVEIPREKELKISINDKVYSGITPLV